MPRAFLLYCFLVLPHTLSAEAPLEWIETKSSIALARGEDVIWRFNYAAELDVPYFHPVSTGDGRVLTWDQPADHAWHHGLWFCWKYINGVNFWEHDRKTGKPAGRTTWSDVQVHASNDHSARISMTLTYRGPTDVDPVLVERRTIELTTPNVDNEFQIDWSSRFRAGGQPVVLDRTPPKARSWGGYAGLSVRFASKLSDRLATSDIEPIEFDSGDRHRSRAGSIDYSGTIDGELVGLAFLDHPENRRHPTPWYVIRSPVMSYVNAALLNDEPMTLEPAQQMTLRYRLIIHPGRWTVDRLRRAQADYRQIVNTNQD